MLKEICKYSLKDVNLIYKDITMLRQKKRGKVERVACVFNLFYVQTFITSFKIRFFFNFPPQYHFEKFLDRRQTKM